LKATYKRILCEAGLAIPTADGGTNKAILIKKPITTSELKSAFSHLCGCHKERGISMGLIMTSLLTLIFCGKNLWRSIETGSTNLRKDTVYRFLNSVSINWAQFLSLLAKKIYGFLRPLTSDERTDCFVLDDTLFDKSKSSKLELMAKVFDHVTRRYRKGFKALTLGYTDGNSFLPLGFNLLSSANQKNRFIEARDDLDKRTNGYTARKRALLPALESAIDLIINALNNGISAKYLLCDSWFTTGKFFKSVLELGLNVIVMLKDMEHQYYLYHGKKRRLSQLYKELKPNNKEKFGKNIHFGTLTAAMASGDSYVNVTITFIETSGKKRDWIAIASTDIGLSAAEITRIYGKRWSIEVFFKTVKSELGFAKEFQGRSFDMLVAHTTIVYVR
jgi:hypothetical protein